MGQRTTLYEHHRRLGARLVEFAGWEMPVSYGSPVAEHEAVRTRCGLFDVSHMGEIEVTGRHARDLCQRLTTNDVGRLAPGQAQYSVVCNERGGVIDDLIVYCLEATRYLMVVNAAHTQQVLAWIDAHPEPGATVRDVSAEWALLALQGPAAVGVVAELLPIDRAQRSFTASEHTWFGTSVLASRTGYTGEDGFELFVPATHAALAWEALLEAARPRDGMPAGLAARDTLRVEAALPLCGTDMDAETTPLEAGLGWVVALDGPDGFIGADALRAQRDTGVPRRLVCFELEGAGVPRHGYPLLADGHPVGAVTSGTKSPTLGRFIGLGYVAVERAVPGTSLTVQIRNRVVPARVVRRPFYQRGRKGE